MKNESSRNHGSTKKLTREVLLHLKKAGFQYVQVRAFTIDWRQDYVEPRFLLLLPFKELPDDPEKRDIYEPIESKILDGWADCPDEGIEVRVANNI